MRIVPWISRKAIHAFAQPNVFKPEANKLFSQLKGKNWLADLSRGALIKDVAEFYGELNMVYPFREGNGRAQRLLFEFLIVNAGYEISWEAVTEEEWLEANIRSAVGWRAVLRWLLVLLAAALIGRRREDELIALGD